MNDYTTMTNKNLFTLCTDRGIAANSKMNKATLVSLLTEYDAAQTETVTSDKYVTIVNAISETVAEYQLSVRHGVGSRSNSAIVCYDKIRIGRLILNRDNVTVTVMHCDGTKDKFTLETVNDALACMISARLAKKIKKEA